MFPADLVTFTEEILNGKLNFLCSVYIDWRSIYFITCRKKQLLLPLLLALIIANWTLILNNFYPLVPGAHKKVTHTQTNLQLSPAGLFK